MKHISLPIAVFLCLAAVVTLSAQDAADPALNPVPQSALASGVFRQEGIASWYGAEFAGRPTASGELFNPLQFTAAHPSLPFGTLLKVTSRHNNRQVVVRVNDRGPYVSARIIDISQAAADALDMTTTGTAPVLVEIAEGSVVTPPPAYQYTPAPLTQAPAPAPQQAVPQAPVQQYPAPQAYPVYPGYQAAPAQQPYSYQPLPGGAAPGQPAYSYQPAPGASAAQPYPGYQPAPAASPQPYPGYPGYQPAPEAVPQPYPGYPGYQAAPAPAPGQPYPYQPAPAAAPQPYPGYPTYQPTPAEAIASQPAAYPGQPAAPQALPSGITPAAIKPAVPPLGTGLRYRVQIGSYKTTKNAVEAFDRLVTLGFQPNYERYQDFYRVVISGVPAEDMELIAERLGAGGFREVLIREEH